MGLLPAATIQQLRPGLGTDGMQSALLSEAKEGSLIRSSHLPGGGAGIDYLALLFENNAELASRLFNRPLGRIQPQHQADLAIYDYHPRTEINAENWRSHVLYGLGNPRDVMTRGRYRLYDGAVVDVQEADVRRRAREQAVRLWQRMKTI